MRIAVIVLACGLALSGCTDLYYQMLGESAWPHEDGTLYTRLGGEAGLTRLVDGWLQTARTDPRIAAKFARADMAELRAGMVQQLCVETGGPCVYTGRGMIDAHSGMVVSNADFDAFLDDLHRTMVAQEIDPHNQRRLFKVLAPMRSDIVAVER